MTEPAVSARGVCKRFGRAWALRDVDLELPAGECLAVLGPNGAGKSTLLRLVGGLARPSAGALRVAGHPAHGREARSRVGFVGHATWLYPALSARENLVFAARLHGVPDAGARADAALAGEGLADAADVAAGSLSRGMAQRLSIARALVHEPELVLLDEPFTGLDRRAAERLAERLAALHARSRSVLLVTHEVALAIRVAGAAVVLAGGRVAFATRDAAREAGALEDAYAGAASVAGAAATPGPAAGAGA